jgi:hypothetical protein
MAGKGKRPKTPKGSFAEPPPPADYNSRTPKFCLHFLRGPFDVGALDAEKRAAFAQTLQRLASSRWQDLITAPRHGQGSELIPRGAIRAPVPPQFEGEDRFMVFRYSGMHPMAGIRIQDVYHVLWIEPEMGDLYDHGS